MDQKLEDLEAQLDPSLFYRANRQFIVRRDAIHHIKYYFNGKLILTVDPPARERIVVSKAKAGDFKEWMSS
jgi:two-component system LytT family response regulator